MSSFQHKHNDVQSVSVTEQQQSSARRASDRIVAFSNLSILYRHTRHRKSFKFKTLYPKPASAFVLTVAQAQLSKNYQIPKDLQ